MKFWYIIIWLSSLHALSEAQTIQSFQNTLSSDTLDFRLFSDDCLPLFASKKELIAKFHESPKVHQFNSKNRDKIIYYSFQNSKIQYIKTDTCCLLSSILFTDSAFSLCYNSFIVKNTCTISDIIRFFPDCEERQFEYPLNCIVSPALFNVEDESKMTVCLPFYINMGVIMRLFFLDDRLIYLDVSNKKV